MIRARLNQIQRKIDRRFPKVCLVRNFWNEIPEKSEEEIIAEYERANNIKVDPESVHWFYIHRHDHKYLDKKLGLIASADSVKSERKETPAKELED